MLHQIGVDLGALLGSKGCPFPVLDGPELRPSTTFSRERIVIEHDPNGDGFVSRHKADTNPRTRLTRNIGVKVTIYAQSAGKGATYWEHKRRAEHVLDMVLIGLDVGAKIRGNFIVFRSGKFVYPEDLKDSETFGGAKYELLLSFDRGVADRNWDGSGLTTAVVSPQLVGGPSLTFDGTAHTITRSFGSWLTDQFAVGQIVIVSASASNNGTKTAITVLTDTVMTFASGLVNETANAMVTGNGVLIKNTDTVQDTVPNTETV